MLVAACDQIVPKFLDQPCKDESGALPGPPLVDEEGKILHGTVGIIRTGYDLDLLDRVLTSNLLSSSAAKCF